MPGPLLALLLERGAMYPGDFSLVRPDSLAVATEARAEVGADGAIYAGGTELILAMKMGMLHYDTLIDIKRISELGAITCHDDVVSIGATVTHHRVANDPLVGRALPVLGRLAGRIANVRVRMAGTLAGNLAFAEPHADPPTLLTALDAQVELVHVTGSRRLTIPEFVLGGYETDLAETEIISSIDVPVPPAHTVVRYDRLCIGERPVVGVAVAAPIDHGCFVDAPVVVVGAVDEKPVRLDSTEVVGARVDDEQALRALAAQVLDAIDPVDDAHGTGEYKRHLSEVLARRVLASVSEPGKERYANHD